MASVKKSSGRPSRREQAAATRQRIVLAAHAAFLERGYAGTPMTAVAEAAGVAVQTVYLVFRTKGDLLQAVYEHVVLGPAGTPPHLSPWWRAAEEADDVDSAVQAFVAGTVELLDRAAPLVYAVLGDDTARTGYEFNERLRREGTEAMVRVLTAKHPLRLGIDIPRARDELLVLTGPLTYVQLVHDSAWSRSEVEAWMTSSILHQLFGL